MSDPRLANLPALRKLAEEEARIRYETSIRLNDPSGMHDTDSWDAMAADGDEPEDHVRTLCIDTEIALLCDLTRWQSQRAMERLVADALGLDIGPTAPSFYSSTSRRSDGLRFWCLGEDVYWTSTHWSDLECVYDDSPTPGISDVTDPAEALTMVALHVLGSPNADR